MPLTLRDLALLRLRNQRLLGDACQTPEDVVGWLGAVQSQDYYGAKWALAQRMQHADDGLIERAYDAGRFLRTHVLRPTWHFVLPADIRWLLALTAPRVKMLLRYYDRQLGIDEALLNRSAAALSGALRGAKHATRAELAQVLSDAGITGVLSTAKRQKNEATGQRLANLLMHAELDALICSGPRRGKHFTYALLDERAALAKPRSRESALAELTLRYFTSHGPALPQDFAWWSGLTLTDAKAGLAAVSGQLAQLKSEGHSYWHAGEPKPPRPRTPIVHMLPNYDEQLIAYKERSAAFASNSERAKPLGKRENNIFNHVITLNGQVIGGWRRLQTSKQTEVTLIQGVRLTAPEEKALKKAQSQLDTFLG